MIRETIRTRIKASPEPLSMLFIALINLLFVYYQFPYEEVVSKNNDRCDDLCDHVLYANSAHKNPHNKKIEQYANSGRSVDLANFKPDILLLGVTEGPKPAEEPVGKSGYDHCEDG